MVLCRSVRIPLTMRLTNVLVLGAVLIGGGYAAWHFTRPRHEDSPPPAPVPVTAVQAKHETVPVYLRGIGTVRALNAVEIRPQVGGTLLDVPVNEGDLVKKDTVLAVIDPRPYKAALDKAQAQLAQDQAQLENAKLDQQRYATLANKEFASRQQLDTQVATVNRLAGVVQADQAAIEEAEINLSYCVLKSPLDGRIGLRRVDPGNLVQANSTGPGILSVVQDQPISVLFTLPDSELPQVRDAMKKGQLAVLADTSDQTRELARGVLLTPDNSVDPASGTIQLKAQFDNPDLALTPGQFVGVRLQVATAEGVAVPHEAVQHGQDGLFVFEIKPDDTTERRVVDVAYDDGKTSVVSKGLDDGARVVVAGQTRIGSNTKVAAHAPGEQPAPPQPPDQGKQAAQR
jgi:membrane fusion protein, multidrug efflux system